MPPNNYETLNQFTQAFRDAIDQSVEDRAATCNYKFPTIEDFQEGGRFADVKLPIRENEPIPDPVLEYIFGSHIDSCKPRHIYNVRLNLNKLLG